jgi:histidinol-phosphate aminotransferase
MSQRSHGLGPSSVPGAGRASAPGSGWGRRQWLGAAGALGAAYIAESHAAHAAPATDAAHATAAARSTSIELSLNENPFGPSALAVRAIEKHLSGLARYTRGEADELVQAIAKREQVAPEQIVLGEVLEALGHQLGRSGGELLYSVPGYTALVDAAQAEGGTGVPVPLDAALCNDLPALRARLNGRTRAVFLVNPHNPSGTVSDATALHEFVAAAAKLATVIVDEAYLEFTSDFAERTLARQVRADGRVVVFRTFSKFYGLAALPLSFAILPTELAAELRRQGLGAVRAQNRLAVVAAHASLRDDAYAQRVRRSVDEERRRWLAVLDELGLRRSQASANFVFFEARRPQPELAAAFLARGIDIGRAFPPLEGWSRISIGLPVDNARAQSVLRQIIRR